MDDERRAVFRYAYLTGAKSFLLKREVKYEGAEQPIENKYVWQR